MPTVTTPVSRSLLTRGGLICSEVVPYTCVLWYPDRFPSEVFMSLLLNELGRLNFPRRERKRAVYE